MSIAYVQAAPYVPKHKTCLPAGRSASFVSLLVNIR